MSPQHPVESANIFPQTFLGQNISPQHQVKSVQLIFVLKLFLCKVFLLSMELKVLSYGATISSLKVHDASGAWREVVLGFDSLDGYLAEENRLGTNGGKCQPQTLQCS